MKKLLSFKKTRKDSSSSLSSSPASSPSGSSSPRVLDAVSRLQHASRQLQGRKFSISHLRVDVDNDDIAATLVKPVHSVSEKLDTSEIEYFDVEEPDANAKVGAKLEPFVIEIDQSQMGNNNDFDAAKQVYANVKRAMLVQQALATATRDEDSSDVRVKNLSPEFKRNLEAKKYEALLERENTQKTELIRGLSGIRGKSSKISTDFALLRGEVSKSIRNFDQQFQHVEKCILDAINRQKQEPAIQPSAVRVEQPVAQQPQQKEVLEQVAAQPVECNEQEDAQESDTQDTVLKVNFVPGPYTRTRESLQTPLEAQRALDELAAVSPQRVARQRRSELIPEAQVARREQITQQSEQQAKLTLFCRLKPLEQQPQSQVCLGWNRNQVEFLDKRATPQPGTIPRKHEFDYVFSPSDTNREVFDHIEHVIPDAIDKKTSAVFVTHGESNSGRSHTIHGNTRDEGIVIRAVSSLFNEIENRHITHRCTVRMSCTLLLEDKVYDLFSFDVPRPHNSDKIVSSPNRLLQSPKSKIRPRKTAEQVNKVLVNSFSDFASCVVVADNTAQIVYPPPKRPQIERAHVIISIFVEVKNMADPQGQHTSQLTFVDCASSTTLREWEKDPISIVEQKRIMLHFSAFNDVVVALTHDTEQIHIDPLDGNEIIGNHVPYRRSVLTTFLQHAMPLDCQIFVILCCNMDEKSRVATLQTLNFGRRLRGENLQYLEESSAAQQQKRQSLGFANRIISRPISEEVEYHADIRKSINTYR